MKAACKNPLLSSSRCGRPQGGGDEPLPYKENRRGGIYPARVNRSPPGRSRAADMPPLQENRQTCRRGGVYPRPHVAEFFKRLLRNCRASRSRYETAAERRQMISLGRQPADGSESWPRPGIAGHRPLAGGGASRRPKAVSNPRTGARKMRDKPRSGDRHIAPTPAAYAAAENLSPPSGASGSCDAWYLGLTPQAINLSRLRRSKQGVIPDPPSRRFFLGVSRGIVGGALMSETDTVFELLWVNENSYRLRIVLVVLQPKGPS
jgi:hypothetical protein